MDDEEEEVVEGELVDLRAAAIEPRRWFQRPAVHTAAAAATGVIAGAATLMLARRIGGRGLRAVTAEDGFVHRRHDNQPVRGGTYLVHIRVVSRP